MRLSEISKKIVSEKSAVMIRPRPRTETTAPWEYDVKDLFTGKKKGWILLDLFTASKMLLVFNAIKPENQTRFDMLPLDKTVDFCMKI
jgi:hypothetical protein